MDETEAIRREMVAEINSPEFEVPAGAITTEQFREQYEAVGFMAPFVMVKVRATGAKGTMQFTHSPRYYFDYVPA